MADVVIRTNPIPRTELAKYFPDNPRLVRLLETLTHDITISIPDVINPDTNTLNDVQEAIGTAQAIAQAAQGLALRALAAATEASDGPPTALALHARLATLERAVAELSEKPTP